MYLFVFYFFIILELFKSLHRSVLLYFLYSFFFLFVDLTVAAVELWYPMFILKYIRIITIIMYRCKKPFKYLFNFSYFS